MRLVMTVDIDMEESGLDPKEIEGEAYNFANELLLIGAIDMDIWKLVLQKVECEGVTWTRQ
ncbi:MAG: hypothetical protein HFI11_07920 [Lachnospiraceae bacterium]|nr:hypothetical protein [Lachnospiraceae bacterium]